MITIRVVEDDGDSRFFRFASPEVRIGYRPGADVSLKPFGARGGEIRIVVGPDGRCAAESVACPGVFVVRGHPVEGRIECVQGDVIRSGSYSLHLEEIAGARKDAPAGEGTDADGGSRGSDSGSLPAAPRKGGAPESYLILFFAPVRQYLEDDDVSEIMINGPDRIYIERKGKVTLADARFLNEQALQAAVKNVARNVGRFFNEENPRLDARLPDGSRVHAVLPPLARCGTTVAIRKFRREKLTMDQLVSFGSVSEQGAALIEAIVRMHKNVIVSGPTSSGKTSVLNVLSSFIAPDERILVIEDASELQLQQEHVVSFETRKPDEHGKGEVTIRDLVASSLRLRPDRLIIGEIRGGEALDMLQAMNTGHSGSMSTIHANGPADCLSRIETCALLSGIDIPLSAIRGQVASAINVVVHTARLGDGSRKITNVAEVMPLEGGEYRVRDLMHFKTEGLDSKGRLIGRHVGAGERPTFFDEARIRGVRMEESWFKSPME